MNRRWCRFLTVTLASGQLMAATNSWAQQDIDSRDEIEEIKRDADRIASEARRAAREAQLSMKRSIAQVVVPPMPPLPPMAPMAPSMRSMKGIYKWKSSSRRHGSTENLSEKDQEALVAVETLMLTGKAKATPVLQKVLAGQYADVVKARALFVLTQIDPTAAEAAIGPLLAPGTSAPLQAEAVRTLANGGKKESLDRLSSLLEKSQDEDVQEAIIDAWSDAGRTDLLQKVATSSARKEPRMLAIKYLGRSGATEVLQKLYSGNLDNDLRMEIVDALGSRGDSDTLLKVASSDPDPEIRREAIHKLGMTGKGENNDRLMTIYRQAKDDDTKEAALNGLRRANAAKSMMVLYQEEKSSDLKRRLMRYIASTDPDLAIELIDKSIK
jgi:HEAT repeats